MKFISPPLSVSRSLPPSSSVLIRHYWFPFNMSHRAIKYLHKGVFTYIITYQCIHYLFALFTSLIDDYTYLFKHSNKKVSISVYVLINCLHRWHTVDTVIGTSILFLFFSPVLILLTSLLPRCITIVAMANNIYFCVFKNSCLSRDPTVTSRWSCTLRHFWHCERI